jgi:Uma2 family endonuclease
MAMGGVKTLFTFEEFERMESKPGKQELIEGELLELPPPELKYQKVSHRIFLGLHEAVMQAQTRGEALRLAVAYRETGYRFPDNSYLVPDVSNSRGSKRRQVPATRSGDRHRDSLARQYREADGRQDED